MKKRVRYGLFAIIMSLALGVTTFLPTNAQTTSLTDAQVELVRQNCQSSLATLTQLHATDALLRVNRGQVYESLLTRMMERFNTRVNANGLDAKAMEAVSTSYERALNTFRRDYQLYEEQLAATLKINCQEEPRAFHFAIESAREKRAKVHEDVKSLHRYVNDYQSVVDDFLLNFERGVN